MSNQYYTVNEMYGEKFFQIPKVLFTNPLYKDGLTAMEKMAFGILRDRFSLSVKNKWFDDEGKIYFIYSRVALAEIFDCSLATATKITSSLVKVGLLEVKKRGQGKTDLLYLKKPNVTDDDIYKIDRSETVGTHERSKKLTSRSKEIKPLGVKKVAPSNTDLSETDLSDLEEEDIYKHENKKEFYRPLINHFKAKGFTNTSIVNILTEMDKQNLNYWTLEDVENQLQYMLNEMSNGVNYGQLHVFFVNGLKNRLEQRRITGINKADEVTDTPIPTHIYYDWLNEA